MAAVVFLASCGAVLAIAFWPMTRGAFTSAEDVRVAVVADAVRDARALIAARDAAPARYDTMIEPASLPTSLRIPSLRYAQVHADHIDLVLARNPDTAVGARIWAVKHRPHHDRPTRYADIYFFRYTNDAAESPDNIP
ncbi:MAG TPA: hypothetical protein VJZ00_14345 [Thermoanaerobaculia bacterium]|nr:hypothetical protein [Thermoanaerobaculia bacterium]